MQTTIPRLSIIIPTYNRARLLERLLNQLASQTEHPHEVIVVDDHSSDDTRQLVTKLHNKCPFIHHVMNDGHHLADGRRTGLRLATGNYVGFIDDDVVIKDKYFIAKLLKVLSPDRFIQPKVIMENFGQRDEMHLTFRDYLTNRPMPILETWTARLNHGRQTRRVFPFNELGIFWHRSLNHLWLDKNLIGDAYGQSYSTALKLLKADYFVSFHPDLVLHHTGAPTGGSKKFNKQLMIRGFSPFHYDYFYNMVYMSSRWLPWWCWLWLPYFVAKSLVALTLNQNYRGWYNFAFKPIAYSSYKHLLLRKYA